MEVDELTTRLGALPEDAFSLQKQRGNEMLNERQRRKDEWPWWANKLTLFFQWLLGVGAHSYVQDLEKLNLVLEKDTSVKKKWIESMDAAKERVETGRVEEVEKHLQWLPALWCNLYVVDVVSRIASVDGEKTKIHFVSDHVVGPAVRLVFWANILLWSFYFVFPWVSYLPSVYHVLWKCEHGNFAHYSFFFLALYLVIVLFLVLIELMALVYVLPSQVAVTGPFMHNVWKKIKSIFHLDVEEFPFYLLMVFLISMSVVAHMDLATNALFLSKVLATQFCPIEAGSDTTLNNIETYWQNLWKSSFLTRHTGISPPAFSTLLLIIWALVFGQFLYGVLSGVPVSDGKREGWKGFNLKGVKALFWSGNRDFYEVRDRDMGGRNFGFFTYSTTLHQRTQHNASLMALAESARMYTIRFNGWSCKQRLVDLKLYKSGQVYNDVTRTLGYFVVFLLLENIIQIELQSTALEVGKALTEEHKVDKEILFSLAMGFTMAAYNLYCTSTKMWCQSIACYKADTHEQDAVAQAYNEKVKKVRLPISVVFFVAAVTLYVVLLLHAVLKTIMVAHYCDCGWNFQFSLDQLSGCVECQA